MFANPSCNAQYVYSFVSFHTKISAFRSQQADVYQKLQPKVSFSLTDPTNPDAAKKNLMKLIVFYKVFNSEWKKESPAYGVC